MRNNITYATFSLIGWGLAENHNSKRSVSSKSWRPTSVGFMFTQGFEEIIDWLLKMWATAYRSRAAVLDSSSNYGNHSRHPQSTWPDGQSSYTGWTTAIHDDVMTRKLFPLQMALFGMDLPITCGFSSQRTINNDIWCLHVLWCSPEQTVNQHSRSSRRVSPQYMASMYQMCIELHNWNSSYH